MPIDLWGATETLGLVWPDRLVGSLLLVVYVASLIFVIRHYRSVLRRMSIRQWVVVVILSVFSLLGSQLFPIYFSIDNQLAPLFIAQNPVTTLTLFAAAPFLLAGATLNPAAALIVGMFGGLGRALGQSHFPFDIFNYGLVAVLASILMQQSYQGRFYKWLRQPVIAGLLNPIALIFLVGASVFASAKAGASSLAALDLALSTGWSNLLPLLIEGVAGGSIVSLILLGLPQLKPRMKLKPSPSQSSVRNQLLGNFALFAVALTLILAVVVVGLSINVSTKLIVNQMAHNAQTVSASIPNFRTQMQEVLLQYSENENLLTDDVTDSEKTLQQLFRSSPLMFRRVLLWDNENGVIAAYPPNGELNELVGSEETAVTRAFTDNIPNMIPAEISDDGHILSIAVPVHDVAGKTTAVLIGRVPQLSLNDLIIGLQGTVGQGSGFIVNERDQIIAHADNSLLLSKWSAPKNQRSIQTEESNIGEAYQGRQLSNARELVYHVQSEAHPWMVVATVPYEVVLKLALSIGTPLTFVVMAVMGAFSLKLGYMGRDIANPLSELVQASKMIAKGGKWTPSAQVRRDDEIGQLNQAFYQMYQSRNKRLNELSLLLGVSHEVSANVNINQGMAAILRGALRATRAVGARAVAMNPSGGYPLQFGEGPISKQMAVLDRKIMSHLRHEQELLLTSPEEIRNIFKLADRASLPISALIAIPLHSHERFQGIMWLGYQEPHTFDQSERNMLQTLAGQAAVLVENSRLFTMAEGGRRRLAAVLASTSDAVIVTDQTNRILLVNRALERIFELKAKQVIGRLLSDVIKVKELVMVLAGDEDRIRNLEIPTKDGKTFYASASPIFNNESEEIGRVAVLHDITHLKEIDKMKSDIVDKVSHDLRNPLTFMRGYVTMISMVGEVNRDQERYIDKIQTGIDHMSQLVKDLLDLSRIESGVNLRIEKIEVQPLLTDIAVEHRQHAHMQGLKIRVDVMPDTHVIFGDKLLIRQAIINLVANGLKYAPNSGVLGIKADVLNREMVFSIRDNGPGIPKQDQMRLFEKFYRVTQRGEEKVEGVGLGLAIVKSIAEQHGGRAWCNSQVGKGSEFYLSIPLSPPKYIGKATKATS